MVNTAIHDIAADVLLSDHDSDVLIQRYIREDPNRHGRDQVRTGDATGSVSVWLIISALRAEDVSDVAASWEIPADAVRAAIAYYRRHRALIDARILLQDEQFIG